MYWYFCKVRVLKVRISLWASTERVTSVIINWQMRQKQQRAPIADNK